LILTPKIKKALQNNFEGLHYPKILC